MKLFLLSFILFLLLPCTNTKEIKIHFNSNTNNNDNNNIIRKDELILFHSDYIQVDYPVFFSVRRQSTPPVHGPSSPGLNSDTPDYNTIPPLNYTIRWSFTHTPESSLSYLTSIYPTTSTSTTWNETHPNGNMVVIKAYTFSRVVDAMKQEEELSREIRNGSEWRVESIGEGCILPSALLHRFCIGQVVARSFSSEGWYLGRLIFQSNNLQSTTSGDGDNGMRETFVYSFLFRVDDKPEEDIENHSGGGESIRKEVRKLEKREWKNIAHAIYKLKQVGIYDILVSVHWKSMLRVYDTAVPSVNIAHGTPAFLPWHRTFLRIFEKQLQQFLPSRRNSSGGHAISSQLGIPYWNWSIDASNPFASELWTPNLLGSITGYDVGGGVVTDGPFLDTKWHVALGLGGPFLTRQLGVLFGVLPSLVQITEILSQLTYDTSIRSSTNENSMQMQNDDTSDTCLNMTCFVAPVSMFSVPVDSNGTYGKNDGLRPTLEWYHNTVHLWVGGTMTERASPNDPLFYLHHSMVDYLWHKWQTSNTTQDYGNGLEEMRMYMESTIDEKRQGQRLDDLLWPWNIRIRDTINSMISNVKYV